MLKRYSTPDCKPVAEAHDVSRPSNPPGPPIAHQGGGPRTARCPFCGLPAAYHDVFAMCVVPAPPAPSRA